MRRVSTHFLRVERKEYKLLILEDTRQQEQKHNIKHAYWNENGVKYNRTKLYCGDYTLPTDQSICVDSKKDIQELISDICGKQHTRFRNELIRANESNITLYILVENKDGVKDLADLQSWENPRLKIMKNTDKVIGTYANGRAKYERVQKFPSATKGVTLFKACSTLQERYDVSFVFCTPEESGKKILNLLGV